MKVVVSTTLREDQTLLVGRKYNIFCSQIFQALNKKKTDQICE